MDDSYKYNFGRQISLLGMLLCCPFHDRCPMVFGRDPP